MANIKVKSKYSGFTIVELIVVIVVIGILAAITLVSYGYLTHRAADTATAANVKQYSDALEMYSFEHGRFPAVDSCMGQKPQDAEGCGTYLYQGCEDLGVADGTIASEYTWNPAFNSALTKYMGTQPNKVQSNPYKTVISLGESCTVTITAGSPVYHWANHITLYLDGPVSDVSKNSSQKAYYILYSINKDGECYLDNSIIIKDYLFNSDMTSCLAYGGNVDIVDEYLIGPH